MNWKLVGRVILKAAVLFVVINLIYAAANPLPTLNKISVYNTLLPGRLRFPYGENPPESYNITLLHVEGLYAAHEVSGREKSDSEYRVFLLGDSAAWGWLLEADQTLSACVNNLNLKTSAGKTIRVYNLGYPILNVTKDLLLLDAAMQHQPDMVVWMTTLASLYPVDQLRHEIVRSNPDRVRKLIDKYDLVLDPDQLPEKPEWRDRTLIAQRREIADWLRHQIYGIAWTITDIDYRNPRFFKPREENLYGGQVLFDGAAATLYKQPHEWQFSDLSLDVINAGAKMTAELGGVFLLINEPIFQSQGVESDLRYNFYYPRWAYDGYRELMVRAADHYQWNYVDLWDAAPNDQFTDTSLHLTPAATCEVAAKIGSEIQHYAP